MGSSSGYKQPAPPSGTTSTTKGGNLGNIYNAQGVQYTGPTDPMAGGLNGYKERNATWTQAYQGGLYNDKGQKLLGQYMAGADKGGASAYWGAAPEAAAPAAGGGGYSGGGGGSDPAYRPPSMPTYTPPPQPDLTNETGMKAGGAYKTLGDIGKNVFDRKATGLKGLTSGGKRGRSTTKPDTKRKNIFDMLGLSNLSKGVTV